MTHSGSSSSSSIKPKYNLYVTGSAKITEVQTPFSLNRFPYTLEEAKILQSIQKNYIKERKKHTSTKNPRIRDQSHLKASILKECIRNYNIALRGI